MTWRKLTAGTLIALTVVVTCLYLFRLAIVESLVSGFLESRGIPGSAAVTRLGPGGIRLENVRLEGLTADSIDVIWHWSPAGGVVVTEVIMMGPDLSIDLTGERMPFSAFMDAFGGPSEDTGQARFFPPAMTVQDGNGTIVTPAGVVKLAFSLQTQAGSTTARSYLGNISAEGPDLAATADVRMDWGAGGPRSFKVSSVTEDERDDGRLTGELAFRWQADRLEADAALAGSLSADLPKRLGMMPGSLDGRVEGSVETEMTWVLTEGMLAPVSEPDHARFRFQIDGNGLGESGIFTRGQIAWSGDALYDRAQDILDLTPASPLIVEASFPGWRDRLPELEIFMAPEAHEDLSATLDTGALRVRPRAGVASTDEARIEVAAGHAVSVRARGPLEIHLGPEPGLTTRLEVGLTLPGLLRHVSDLSASGVLDIADRRDGLDLALTGPVSMSLKPDQGALPAPWSWLGGDWITISAVAQVPEGPPCMTIHGLPGNFAAHLECRMTVSSSRLGKIEFQAKGQTRQTAADALDLNLPALTIRINDLRSPYGIVDELAATGAGKFQDGQLEASFAADASGRELEIRGASVDQGTITVAGSLAGTPEALHLKLQPSRARADTVVMRDPSAFRVSPVSVETDAAEFNFRSGIPTGAASLTIAPTSLHTGDLRIDLGAAEIMLSSTPAGRPAAELRIDRIEAPELGMGAYDLGIDARQTGTDRYEAALLRASIRDLTLPQRLPASKWSGTLSADGAQVAGQFEGRPDAAPQIVLSMTGRYDSDQGRGHGDFRLDGAMFRPGLQPRALLPSASGLKNVYGNLAFSGEAEFDASGLVSSDGRLQLDLDSFESEGTRVAGLSLPLTLSSLWPVATPPGQHLTIDRIGDGTGASAIDLEFRLIPGADGAPAVEIGQGVFETLGGRIRIPPARFDPGQSVRALVLEADHLDLVSVLSLITQEGIAGEGQLSGRFPIRLEGDDLVVDGAVLESEAPGRLAFSSPAARQTLKPGGDHVTLMLQALENFHYERLSLTVDKAAAGDARLRLSLNGYNPDVLDGYPFALNIDLQTDVAPFLSVLRQGNDMVDEVVKRIWRP